MINRKKTAIVVIDMQEDFFNENPVLRKKKNQLIKNINELTGFACEKSISVIFVRQEFKADLSDIYLFMKKSGRRVTIGGTKGADIVSELKIAVDDIIIKKNRYSAFFKTRLEKMLQNKNIATLILAGINTHACVRMTAIDAYQRDINVILARDCIASWDKKHHDITIDYLAKTMGIEALANKQLKSKFR